jgi:hypothetical protein
MQYILEEGMLDQAYRGGVLAGIGNGLLLVTGVLGALALVW